MRDDIPAAWAEIFDADELFDVIRALGILKDARWSQTTDIARGGRGSSKRQGFRVTSIAHHGEENDEGANRNDSHRGLLLDLASIPALAARQKFDSVPDLGIRVVDILPGLEDVVGVETSLGAYVVRGMLVPSPDPEPRPDRIETGDFIVGIGGQAVRSTEDLHRLVQPLTPYSKVAVTVIRRGKEKRLRVTVDGVPPVIYFPVATCPVLNDGYFNDPWLGTLSNVQMFGIVPSSANTTCRFVTEACTPLQLQKQTDNQTFVKINGFTYGILGDWRAHTHLDFDACRKEQAALGAPRNGRRP